MRFARPCPFCASNLRSTIPAGIWVICAVRMVCPDGPLTLDQLSFNLPPLPATPTIAPSSQPSKTVVATGNTSNRMVVRDVLELLVALGLVQQEDTSIVPAAGIKSAAQSSPQSPPSTAPQATSRPPRYCINEGRPRETTPSSGSTYNIITPTNVLAEIRKAEAEIVATQQRIQWLSEALSAPTTTAAATTTATATTARSTKEGKKKNSVRMGSIAAAGETLKQIVLRYPDMAYDPLYVTALRNLQVDSLLALNHNSSSSSHSPGNGITTSGKGVAGSSRGGVRGNTNATGKRKRKTTDKTSTNAANKKVARLALPTTSATTSPTITVPKAASQDRTSASAEPTIPAGGVGAATTPNTGNIDAKHSGATEAVRTLSGDFPLSTSLTKTVKPTSTFDSITVLATPTVLGISNPQATSGTSLPETSQKTTNARPPIATTKTGTKDQTGVSPITETSQSQSTTGGIIPPPQPFCIAALPFPATALTQAAQASVANTSVVAKNPAPAPSATTGSGISSTGNTKTEPESQNQTSEMDVSKLESSR